jgi:hypothetical protein
MRSNIIIQTIKNIVFFCPQKNNFVGRWNVKDNSTIKATLANMDCCGDNLCGKPENFSTNIQEILKEPNSKN